MKTVYVVYEVTSEDYHGSSKEIVSIHNNADNARKQVNQLCVDNYKCNVEYYYEQFNVIP